MAQQQIELVRDGYSNNRVSVQHVLRARDQLLMVEMSAIDALRGLSPRARTLDRRNREPKRLPKVTPMNREPAKTGTSLAARVHQAFSNSGLLSRSQYFEYRAEQQQMATKVAAALERDRCLVVEAGTGVGKSLAYLLPAVMLALEKSARH